MFVDLDWPLNASSLLSASAELLVSLHTEMVCLPTDVTQYTNYARCTTTILIITTRPNHTTSTVPYYYRWFLFLPIFPEVTQVMLGLLQVFQERTFGDWRSAWFFTGRMSFPSLNQQCQSTEGAKPNPNNTGNGMVWYSKGLTSHSTQNRSFRRRGSLSSDVHLPFSNGGPLLHFIAYSAGALLCPQCAASRHE